ncbi:MAG: hypothetical protein SGBAC_003773 [Bacillariaceae sp.]
MNREILIMQPHHDVNIVPEPTPIDVHDMRIVDRISFDDAKFVRDCLGSGILALLNSGNQMTSKIQHQHSSDAITPIKLQSLNEELSCKSDYSETSSQGSTSKSHSEKWNQRFQDISEFLSKHGHCLVPLDWPENPALAHWIKHQRGQHKAKHCGKHSTLTDAREQALENLGFVWDSHRATWEERFRKIVQFQAIHGHSNLPSRYEANPRLSTWVKCQRRQFKLFQQGKKSQMTKERIAKLTSIGFVWYPRHTTKTAETSLSKLGILLESTFKHTAVWMDSFEEEEMVVPLADGTENNSQRPRSFKRRSSGQSLEGSAHSTSSYTFEDVDSIHSEYSFETLEDSFHNSISSFGDAAIHTPLPTSITSSVPSSAPSSAPSDALSDMKKFLRSELGLETPPKKAEPQKEAPKNSALTEMKTYLRSELGIGMSQSSSSGPQNSKVSSGSADLPMPSVSVENSKKSAQQLSFEESELARSIAALKEGVDVEEIEYIISDDEMMEEIIDDVFDHMGGLEGRDTVMLESYGLHSIVEVTDSEYASEVDDSAHRQRISESSMMSQLLFVGDTNDEVDTIEMNEPHPTGIHETVQKSHEQLDRDNVNVDESGQPEIQKDTSPTSGKKAAKWKDRLKKKRSKSGEGHDCAGFKMDVDDTTSEEPENRTTAVSPKPAIDTGTGPSKASSPKSNAESEENQHGRLSSTKLPELSGSQKERKADDGKPDSDGKAEMKELTLSKASPESKSSRGKKAAKWKDRVQKRRSKSIEGNEGSIISSPKSANLTDTRAISGADAAENDLQQAPPNVPIHVANDKRGRGSNGVQSQQVRDKPESLDFAVGDIVMKVDGVKKVKTISPPESERARAPTKQNTAGEDAPSIPPATILFRTNTIGEREGDEENGHGGEYGGTSHSMRIFDDEFGSVGLPSLPFDRSGASFDRTLSNDDDSNFDQESVYYQQSLNDDTSGRGPGSRRDALRVFDDELGESASYARSSIYSMRSRQSTILGELEEEDNDDESSGSNGDGDSLLSEEVSAGPNERGDKIESSSAGSTSRRKARARLSRERNGEAGNKNKMKFELPNELLETIHSLHNNENADEEETEESDKDLSNFLATKHKALVDREKDGSATNSTVPPTFEDSSRTIGDEAAENTAAGISTPELTEEAIQDCARRDEETAQSIHVEQVVETERESDAKKNAIPSTVKVFPGRLPPDRRILDKETGKNVSFLAAFEMTTKRRRREIVLRSTDLAAEGILPESASSEDPENKHSRDGSGLGNQKLVESLKARSRMATRAGRKKLVLESIKATMPKESSVSSILWRKDSKNKQTSITTKEEIAVKPSAGNKGSGRKTRSKSNGSKRSKADGNDEGKIGPPTDGIETPKTRSRKRSKTRIKKAPRRCRSLGTEDFLESLNSTESMSQTGARSNSKEDKDGNLTKITRSRTRGLPRSRSMGPMESLRLKKRKEKSNGEGANSTEGSRREKRAASETEKLALSKAGKDPSPEFTEPMSLRTQPRKSRKEQQSTDEEHSDLLLSPSKNRRRKNSDCKSPKAVKPSLRRRKSEGKSPKNGNRKTIDKIRSPSSRKKSLELPQTPNLKSPNAKKKSVDLTEDLKDEMKSPKKPKPSLRRSKSGNGKSPRNSNRKSVGKIRTLTTKKKSLVLPDLESELMSPQKSQFNRRSLDPQSPQLAKKDAASKRRHSDSPSGKNSPLVEDASRQRLATTDQPSSFMEYYDAVRRPSRTSILKSSDDMLALKILEEESPSPSTPSAKHKKSKLRRVQSDSVKEMVEADPPMAVEDIWGLVKWRDQVDRL